MKRLLTSISILITLAMLAVPVFGQFPPQGPPPSAEQMAEAQRQMMEMMKAMAEKAFDSSDEDDNDSLTKEELVEFGVAMALAQNKAMRDRGAPVPEPTEDDIKQMREMGAAQVEMQFPMLDTDKSGEISKKELLKQMLGEYYSEDEESEDTKNEDESGASESDSSEESGESDDASEPASDAS